MEFRRWIWTPYGTYFTLWWIFDWKSCAFKPEKASWQCNEIQLHMWTVISAQGLFTAFSILRDSDLMTLILRMYKLEATLKICESKHWCLIPWKTMQLNPFTEISEYVNLLQCLRFIFPFNKCLIAENWMAHKKVDVTWFRNQVWTDVSLILHFRCQLFFSLLRTGETDYGYWFGLVNPTPTIAYKNIVYTDGTPWNYPASIQSNEEATCFRYYSTMFSDKSCGVRYPFTCERPAKCK